MVGKAERKSEQENPRGVFLLFWKLIPHGNHLYTVVNTYGGRKHDHYGQYLSFDTLSRGRSRLTVEGDADLWEIYGNHQKR